MISLLGEKRVLDKLVLEDETSTAAARVINLTGTVTLDDLSNSYLIVKNTFAGVADTTIQINDLATANLKILKNGVVSNTTDDWIKIGQLYYLTYDGSNFVAYPISESDSGTVASNPTCDLPAISSEYIDTTITDITTIGWTADDFSNFLGNVFNANRPMRFVIEEDSESSFTNIEVVKLAFGDSITTIYLKWLDTTDNIDYVYYANFSLNTTDMSLVKLIITRSLSSSDHTWMNITIPASGWTTSTAPYTYTHSETSITSNNYINVYPVWSDSLSTRTTERTEYSKISLVSSSDGSIIFTCDEEIPSIDLNVRCEIFNI